MLTHGDCLEVLRTLPDNSVDSLVTDPPAGIGFMGKEWDHHKGGRKEWCAWMESVMRECLRVMKPGAHGLVWALPRTSHWTATALEDAGFEIRDCVYHLFGSGFPKSLDVSKAIDKAAGVEGEIIGKNPAYRDKAYTWSGGQGETPMRPEFKRGPATDAAKQWTGFGTALKPAVECWWLVRKPCSEKTVAANVLKWGTGALNIDASRIAGSKPSVPQRDMRTVHGGKFGAHDGMGRSGEMSDASQGRFPANLILSHSPHCTETQCDIECAIAMLDEQSGVTTRKDLRTEGKSKGFGGGANCYGESALGFTKAARPQDHGGGASRFFYSAKISSSERNAGVVGHLSWESVDLSQELAELNQRLRDISVDTMQYLDGMSWSIGLDGHSISERYPQGFKSTIETVTRLITELKTSNFSQHSTTRESILDAIRTVEAIGLSPAESVTFLNQLNLNSTNEATASALGASSAVLPTLCKINALAKRGNIHSTVKPQKLMRYLVTMVTPPGGVVLDPFMGSGSTGLAAKSEGFGFVGIEREAEYFEIAEARIGRSAP